MSPILQSVIAEAIRLGEKQRNAQYVSPLRVRGKRITEKGPPFGEPI